MKNQLTQLAARSRVLLQSLVRLSRWTINRLQIRIPVNRRRALALGFFVFDGPREWGLGCITFDGPNYYLAAGNIGFGWGMVDRMESLA